MAQNYRYFCLIWHLKPKGLTQRKKLILKKINLFFTSLHKWSKGNTVYTVKAIIKAKYQIKLKRNWENTILNTDLAKQRQQYQNQNPKVGKNKIKKLGKAIIKQSNWKAEAAF